MIFFWRKKHKSAIFILLCWLVDHNCNNIIKTCNDIVKKEKV